VIGYQIDAAFGTVNLMEVLLSVGGLALGRGFGMAAVSWIVTQ